MTSNSSDECRHGLSWQIEPPNPEGWMRRSCGACGQILAWTLSPHYEIADAALRENFAVAQRRKNGER